MRHKNRFVLAQRCVFYQLLHHIIEQAVGYTRTRDACFLPSVYPINMQTKTTARSQITFATFCKHNNTERRTVVESSLFPRLFSTHKVETRMLRVPEGSFLPQNSLVSKRCTPEFADTVLEQKGSPNETGKIVKCKGKNQVQFIQCKSIPSLLIMIREILQLTSDFPQSRRRCYRRENISRVSKDPCSLRSDVSHNG